MTRRKDGRPRSVPLFAEPRNEAVAKMFGTKPLDPYPMLTTVGRHSKSRFCEDDLECSFQPRGQYSQNPEDYT